LKNKAFALVIVMAVMVSTSYAQNAETDFNVTLTEDGTGAVITKYTGKSKSVRIPTTIQGFPVKEIERNAFKNADITSVIIPEGVTRIMGFEGCKNLTSVTLPSTITSIYSSAFSDCFSLTTINLPVSLKEIDGAAFYGTGLTSINWPTRITIISEGMFSDSKLRSIVIPEGITVIGRGAFANCVDLTSVTLPSTIRVIRDKAFELCSSLTTVNIPESVTSISLGNYVFKYCAKLNLASQAALMRLGIRADLN